MNDENQQPRPNIHLATYKLLRHLAQQMEPVSRLAQEADTQNQPNPADTMIELLRQVVTGVEQLHGRLEKLEARLDDPAVVKAIKAAIHG
jgi:hypothetical protein